MSLKLSSITPPATEAGTDTHGGPVRLEPAGVEPKGVEPKGVEPKGVEPKGVEVVNFGCRLNAFESQVMRERAAAAGVEDVVIINSCAVTQEAERQARQTIRRLRRERPNSQIIVTGCAAEVNNKSFAQMPEVSGFISNHDKLTYDWGKLAAKTPLPLQAPPHSRPSQERSAIFAQSSETPGAEDHFITKLKDKARAFIQVQNGCDHRCSFCIIPFGRGPSRSVALGPIVQQITKLVEHGCHEVVISGVDVTSWGQDLPGKPRLGALLKRLFSLVPALPRLRLSSLDPAELDEDLWALLAEEPRFMPHWHLSLQAGHDGILKRMARRHRQRDLDAIVARARDLRPDIVFGADVIAGFPGETAAMFAEGKDFIAALDIAYLHVFPYSPRPGTAAAKMDGAVPVAERRARSAELRAIGQESRRRLYQKYQGEVVEVLTELNGYGHSPQFLVVEALDAPPGQLVRRRIIGHVPERKDGGFMQAAGGAKEALLSCAA
jgi:threonylcarbamoyladenosine tRNA methylthiotransferase MtaB